MAAPDAGSREPSVAVGIPTYNRAGTLGRAIESVISQTHAELDLVISDNASDDGTREICERYARSDPRVRYLRQPLNRGPTANFNTLFRECRGDYVLMLSDDDWLDGDYVECCLAELVRNGDRVLVCGLARYFDANGDYLLDGVEMQLLQETGAARARAYFARVRDNGTFYGLISREALVRAAPLLNVLGNDWLLIAAVAYQGKVSTLRSTSVNRVVGGTSRDIASVAATFGKPAFQTRMPQLVMAWHVLAEMGWRAQVYTETPIHRRLALGARSALSVIDWRSLAWHLTAPTAAGLLRRPRGGAVGRAYFNFTRRLGAGRQGYF